MSISQTPTLETPRLPDKLIDDYIAQVRRRQDGEARAAYRQEPTYALSDMVELIEIDVAELAVSNWGEAERLIIAKGYERDLSLIGDELDRRAQLVYTPSDRWFDRDFPRRLREQVDLAEFLSHRGWVTLKRTGGRYTAICPFHTEKSASFTVWSDHWYCFGCGAGGDIYSFVQQAAGVRFTEALAIVAGYVGIALPQRSRVGAA